VVENVLKKTPIAQRFVKQLIKVNDQACYFTFYQWEFNQILKSIPKERSEEFTTDVFSKNPYAESIYRRIVDLPLFSSEAEQVALRMSVISSVEHMLEPV